MNTTAPDGTPRMVRRFRFVAWIAAVIAGLGMIAGCGTPGAPQPPSLKLPVPPADLSAVRVGDRVTLRWTMPRRATDRVPLEGDQRVGICRAVGVQACARVGELLLQPGLPAAYTDALADALRAGPPELLTYTVVLQNHKGQSAGPSNPAFTAGGAAPPAMADLQVRTEARGIVLQWQVAPGVRPAAVASGSVERGVRLHRTRIFAPGESGKGSSKELQAGVPQPEEQALEVPEPPGEGDTLAEGWPLDHAIDHDALLNRTYRYTVERVAKLRIAGHAVEVSGEPSLAVTLVARDLFPPAVPQGVAAVADLEPPGRPSGIDLSWTAVGDPDLAGYVVYRRSAGGGAVPARVSGSAAVSNAAWRDLSAAPGQRYAYSVSAVDTSGNESERSAEAEETMPLRP